MSYTPFIIAVLVIFALLLYFVVARKYRQHIDNTKFSRSYLTTVDLLLGNQQKEAVRQISNLIQQSDDSPIIDKNSKDSLLFLANIARSTGELDKAIKYYQEILKNEQITQQYTDIKLVNFFMANCYYKMGIYDRAEAIYLNLLEDPEYYLTVCEQLTILYIAIQDWQKALRLNKELSKRIPDTNRNQLLAILYCLYLRKVEEHLSEQQIFKTFNRVLKLDPASRIAHIDLGNYYLKHKFYDAALEEFTKAMAKDPGLLLLILPELQQLFELHSNVQNLLEFIYNFAQSNQHKTPFLVYAQLKSEQASQELKDQTIDQVQYNQIIYQLKELLLDKFSKTNDLDLLLYALELKQISSEELNSSEQLLKFIALGTQTPGMTFKRFSCEKCSYRTSIFQWICPNCRKLDSFKVVPNKLNQLNN